MPTWLDCNDRWVFFVGSVEECRKKDVAKYLKCGIIVIIKDNIKLSFIITADKIGVINKSEGM